MVVSKQESEKPGEMPLNQPHGLSSQEVAERLAKYGLNAVAEEKLHPVLFFLKIFWGPVPWMLEVTVILELVLGKGVEAAIIGALLVVNAILSFFQENRAQSALTLLRQQLTVQSRVLRDGQWQLIPAQNLVPGDVIHLRMGDLVPADVALKEGQIQLDQSALTGESALVDRAVGQTAYS